MAARNRAAGQVPSASARPDEGLGPLLVPLGVLAALMLPYFVFSLASDDSMREVKLFAQALGGACVLFGLAVQGRENMALQPTRPRLATVAAGALAAALVLTLVSGILNGGHADPLAVLAVLAPLALVSGGTSRIGAAASGRIFLALSLAGVVTGLLAVGQRFAGLPRLPLQVPEPRFLTTALLGNPGDVAAALVFPAILLWASALSRNAPRPVRILSFLGLGIVLLGLGAAESVMPILAVLVGMLVHVLFDFRRRVLPFAAGLTLAALAIFSTGAGNRILTKLRELRSGQINRVVTQRDIGIEAAREMIRIRPFFGVGPGCFSNAFVPARLLAETRVRRRMVHFSESSHFENAHCEPFTLAAECGLPAASFGLVALGALLAGLIGRRRQAGTLPGAPESGVLFALLIAFAVLGVASFPLRLPVTSGPAAYVAGLAWSSLSTPRQSGGDPRARHRRLGLFLAAASLAALASVRLMAAMWQAEGEEKLLEFGGTAGPARLAMMPEAKASLRRSLFLRPRKAATWLALGSVLRLDQDSGGAWDSMLRSHALEERGETDLNLGRVALERGDAPTAFGFFVRAVWIFPRLLDSLPDEALPSSVEADVREAERGLTAGGLAPPLPAPVAARSFLLSPQDRFFSIF
ncbi:MAG: O-antigen ligase family protein [Thermoanaerobaculia bacterium]